MHDVNWWLMALAFLLGLLLTLAMMIRRVTREVPITHPVAATATAGSVVSSRAETKADDHVVEHEPYGAGSIRVRPRTAAPAGYTIKGDKDTGRYFTLDSPEYETIEAEVWFANEDSAQKAGFLRWNTKGDKKTTLVDTGAAAVINEEHVPADIVIAESGSTADASLVIVESEAPEADSTLRIVSDKQD